ncbi:hypothetical protein GCM10023168_07440 [Fodinibacter luteus]|uniref:DUF4386 family protein n=1 Tax=Fodinibacter luteus TaxID=552064 RepID=A0ABP8K3S8_9MICO
MSTTSTTQDLTEDRHGARPAATPTTSTSGTPTGIRAGIPPADTPTSTRRGWAWSGVAAGVAGIVSIAASMRVDAVYAENVSGDPDAVVARLAEQTAAILTFHTATLVSLALLVVFAAGLRRRLAGQLPSRSLLPDVAAAGLGLVTVAQLLGSGLTTEFVFGVADHAADLVPEAAVFFGHWVGTIPWLWVGAGIAGVAVSVAALRHGAAARWVGVVGAVLGGLTLVLGISPLQYLAGMVGPVWLLVTALGLALGDRARRG